MAVRVVTYDDRRGHWDVTAEGKALLSGIHSEICIIGIAGAMRSGKSYLTSLLADISLPERQLKLFNQGLVGICSSHVQRSTADTFDP